MLQRLTGKGSHMTDLEKLFGKTDFSKESNFKETLRGRLFSGGGVTTGSFGKELSDEELGLVNAAGTGTVVPGPGEKDKGV